MSLRATAVPSGARSIPSRSTVVRHGPIRKRARAAAPTTKPRSTPPSEEPRFVWGGRTQDAPDRCRPAGPASRARIVSGSRSVIAGSTGRCGAVASGIVRLGGVHRAGILPSAFRFPVSCYNSPPSTVDRRSGPCPGTGSTSRTGTLPPPCLITGRTSVFRSLLLYLSKARWARRIITGWSLSRRVARRFVAGDTLDDAIQTVAPERRRTERHAGPPGRVGDD